MTMHIGVVSQHGPQDGTYTAPVLPESRCPGLLGQEHMREHRMILDTYNNKAYTIGPGGYQIHLSTGSRIFDLAESAAGHLMLPCSNFPIERTRQEDMVVFHANDLYGDSNTNRAGSPATTS